MDRLLLDFRRSPAAYLSSRGIASHELVEELLQLLRTTSDKNDNAKVAALGVLQEASPLLLNTSTSLENAVTTLITIFQQFRSSGSPVVCSQILCTVTSILIEMELVVEGEFLQVELIQLLFDVIEKVKSPGSPLVRATACDCLRELELAFPGILSSKIGHFYGMSQTETSYIFQHYLLLLATVLEHTVKKYALALELGHTPDSTLYDILSHADTLKVYSLPENFRQTAKGLLSKPPTQVLGNDTETADIRRAVSFILDNYHLLTPPCLVSTLINVLDTIQLSSLAPKILKSLILHYQSCQNCLPFYLVLLLQWRFGDDIFSEQDADSVTMWFTLMASNPSLPTHQRELMLTYSLEWPQRQPPLSQKTTTDSEGEMADDEGDGEVIKDYRHMLLPSVFDTYSIYYYKVKALKYQVEMEEEGLSSPLPLLLYTVLKQVQYGIKGAPIVTLFRLLYSYYSNCVQHTSGGTELCRLVTDIVKDHPEYIPYMINFITAVQSSFPSSPVPLRLLADYLHHISTSLPPLLTHLPLFLLFLKQASLHLSINPLVVIHYLSGVLQDAALCDVGSWEVGSAILNIINTIMRRHYSDSVFKGLTDLLNLVSTNYSDIDIQDRARFYHQLILSVSGEKLSAILALASDDSAGSTLSDIVEARIADNTYPSAPPIKTIAEQFLSITRVEVSEEEFYKKGIYSEDCSTAVKDYMMPLEDEREKYSFSIHYRIQFLHCPEGVSDRIYAAVLKLSTDGPYHICPDVYLPYMVCRDSGTLTKSSEKFIKFTFFPKQPVPAVFQTRVIFSTEEGVTCVCGLGDIEVRFEDLFQPLPSSPISMQGLPQVTTEELFQQLWSKFESSQSPVQEGGRFGVLSTVHLEMSKKELEFRAERLQLLQIPPSNTVTVTANESCYLVFLPPSYHLLLRVRSDDVMGGGVAVSLATDCWRCLGLVSDYLHLLQSRTS